MLVAGVDPAVANIEKLLNSGMQFIELPEEVVFLRFGP
jgi:hypothetical protein